MNNLSQSFIRKKKDIKTGKYLKWIQEHKINPDSSMIAFGSHCGKYIFSLNSNFIYNK